MWWHCTKIGSSLAQGQTSGIQENFTYSSLKEMGKKSSAVSQVSINPGTEHNALIHFMQQPAPSGTTTAHLSVFLLSTSQHFEMA